MCITSLLYMEKIMYINIYVITYINKEALLLSIVVVIYNKRIWDSIA